MNSRTAGLVVAALLIGLPLKAQELRGTVSDSASRLPVPGAVVMLFDSSGTTLARGITNEHGEYRFPALAHVRRVRVVRMGFRPRELSLSGTPRASLDVAMVTIPTLLDPVRAIAGGARCSRRADRAAAVALRDQARAGLLATVVARQASPAQMVVVAFRRTMDGTSNRIEHQTVQLDSTGGAMTSFYAARSASDFVLHGFVGDGEDKTTYYGPDADVLLDDAFADGYCFHIREADRRRANQIGLAFTPAGRRRGRIDVDGTLWIDTVARQLRDIEFRYLGLSSVVEVVRPGGSVSFWEVPNGVAFIDRWSFRLPAVTYDTIYNHNNVMSLRPWYYAMESGGEVVTAIWPDGHRYHAPLGTLHARAVDMEGRPATGIVVRLAHTDYLTSPDSAGWFEIPNLLPGPYIAIVIHPAVASLGITLPTALRFAAARDSVHSTRLLVPNVDEYVTERCEGTALSAEQNPWLVATVTTPDGRPVRNAHWQLSKDNGVPWQRIVETRTTGTNGRVYYCMKLDEGDVIEMRAWRDGEEPKIIPAKIHGRHAKLTVELPFPAHATTSERQ